MDAQTAATLQLIARAFASSPTKYSVTVAPHPLLADAYDVLFSRPTAEAPESPLFVKLTLTERPANDGERHFEGLVENQKWPITLSIDQNFVLKNFPHGSIDVAWEHKLCVSRIPLWTKESTAV
ncbi:hypothetical protein ABL78_1629 [Leptomonas seymouri]|uniref:Uncharacterized protein n=1 Tax=Leptomonas seymouri TaxID=5684 RepID=A0A0N0P7Y0_LEPSE|nr:hypothetical protein ABL78_1629 [Leptomonas seymouri]|eukprot:KPI89296.1 hypothetical protein ABL78_1629 [Leptomonas seymouri]